jgi:glycosyltransferase involved in cell wall biosynthesis
MHWTAERGFLTLFDGMRSGADEVEMRMKQVVAFTRGLNVPSARFRVRQLIGPIRRFGIDLQESFSRRGAIPPAGLLRRLFWLPSLLVDRYRALGAAQESADVGLFQRELVSTLLTLERRWNKPAVLDVDDAIWLNQRFNATDRLARWAGTVICGNDYIAEHFAPYARTVVIPTGVDVARFRPSDPCPDSSIIVWSGTSGGLPFLESIEPALLQVFRKLPRARLRIVSDSKPAFGQLPPENIEIVPWTEESEVSALQDASIGIMPLPDTPWTRGKCSFKMLCYMSCSLPVVVSPVGMNATLLARDDIGLGARTMDEWTDSLVLLLGDPAHSRRMGRQGRDVVLRDYATEVIAERVADVLNAAA